MSQLTTIQRPSPPPANDNASRYRQPKPTTVATATDKGRCSKESRVSKHLQADAALQHQERREGPAARAAQGAVGVGAARVERRHRALQLGVLVRAQLALKVTLVKEEPAHYRIQPYHTDA